MTALGNNRAAYYPGRRRPDPWTASLQTPGLAGVYFVASIAALAFGSPFVVTNFLFACLYANPQLVLTLQQRYGVTLRRWKLSPVMITGCLLGFLGGATMIFSIVDPAHAQFFQNAETFLEGIGGDAAVPEGVIPLVMNTIRALFVIYMIFGLVQVINAVRQGEEWKDLAKTPFLILMVGVLGDVLVGAIAGA